MPLRIRLLGRPALERDDGGARLEGRKTWALLALVLLGSRPPTRREIVERLWPDADDPLAAMRWALSQVRKALAPDVDIVDRDGRLSLDAAGAVTVDAHELLRAEWVPTSVEDLVRGELLEGMAFDDAPDFERWLGMQRARVSGASADAIRTAAGLLVRTEPTRALQLAERGLLADPFDETLHALVVETHIRGGSLDRARAHVDETRRRYRDDLGLELPDAIAGALDRPPAEPAGPLLRLDIRARALLDGALARSSSGDHRGALDMTRRALDDAIQSGDIALEGRLLTHVVNFMTLAMVGTPREWMGMLHRALVLASELGDREVMCDIEVERGRIASLLGRYGEAEAALRRAVAMARELGDDGRVSFARRFLGICETDRCDFSAAEEDLRAAEEHSRHPEAVWAWLARLLVKMTRYDEAAALTDRCVAALRTRGVALQLPLALAQAGEVALARGDLGGAAERFSEAFTHADETNDVDWMALALRGLALVDVRDGRPERARATLVSALARSTSRPACYRWVEALILADLVEWEGGADRTHVERGLQIALAAPMPDLAARLLPFRGSHTPPHTVTP